MGLNVITMAPWDFTLHQSNDGGLILKVMVCEGEHKIDIARYFALDRNSIDLTDIEGLKKLSSRIRANYPNTGFKEMDAPPRR